MKQRSLQRSAAAFGLTAFLCFCLSLATATAVDLEKAVEMLEAAGDYETAEPIAFKLTQEKPEHYYRVKFLSRYPASDFAEVVYLQTWRDIKDARNIPMLRSFVKAMPGGAHSLEALDRLFELYREEDTILGYQEYIRDFPNSPKAVDALQSIFRLALRRAVTHADKLDSVDFFDEYIRTFPTSPYLEEANRKAEEMEYAAITDTLGGISLGNLFSNRQQQKETIARKLYNEMRFWQRNGQLLIGQRKYNLLQKDLFIDTEAYTEMMDREETIAFRKSVVSFQERTNRQLDDLNELYRQESKRIIDTIRREAELTRTAIAEQGGKTRGEIRRAADGIMSGVSALSYEKGRLADAVNQQTDRMMDEARRASYEQQQMFDRAEEEARRRSRQSRHCAEVLSRHGKYPMFSGCP